MAELYKQKGLSVRRLLFGDPLSTSQLIHERLTKIKALAVFASDALSSTAYATEEMMLILILAGSGAAHLAWPLALAIAGLLTIVASSYHQTIHAYPNGGGSYIVSHDNLGQLPGLIAAASLLTDYVLTVSVSISAGVAALTSMAPALFPYRVEIGLVFVVVMMILNLRGVRESGTVFAIPTYIFLFIVLALIATGMVKWIAAGMPAPAPPQFTYPVVHSLTIFLVLRAFSSGCAALTGVEAISNGVPAFKPPEARNAAKTLTAMAGLLIILFLGVTFLVRQFGVVPDEVTHETLVSQLGRAVFGSGTLPYYALQAATMMILVLAANTSFADFPRLSSLLARDRYLPHQFSHLGDRLAFSNGIIVLAAVSSALIVLFGAKTTRLIPLYALGVFLSFTLSQLGMVVRWRRIKGPRWQLKALVNAVGAVVTGIVLIIFAVTKFVDGAWIVIVWVPIFVSLFLTIHHHYMSVAKQLSLETYGDPSPICHNRVIVPIGDVHRAVLAALHYAQSLSGDVTAVYVETDPTRTPRILEKWQKWGKGIPLEVLPSPYRSILRPLVHYVDQISDPARRDEVVTIVLPQFVTARPWQQLLHNQTALLIQMAFLFRREVIVVNVPFHLREAPA